MASSKLSRTLDILSKPSERRSLTQLNAVAAYLASVLQHDNIGLLKLIALYLRLHLEECNLTKSLDDESRVYLLTGTVMVEDRHTGQQQVAEAAKTFQIGSEKKLFLQDRSIAASISKVQYQNCLQMTEEGSLEDEMQFIQQNSYFSRVGLITCLTLLTNLEVRKVVRGQKVGSLSRPSDSVFLVRKGQLQICKENQQGSGSKSIVELMSFPAGEFFGYFLFRNQSSCDYAIRCKSAYCTLLQFTKEFFESYITVICGDQLQTYQENITKYLQRHEAAAGLMRKTNMKFLTQTQFNQRKSIQEPPNETLKPNLPVLHSKQINRSPEKQPNFQTKSLSSRQLKHQDPPFEQLSRLEFRRSKCGAYERLRQPLPLTRNQIFYDFFKNNWEASYAKRKLSEQRRY